MRWIRWKIKEINFVVFYFFFYLGLHQKVLTTFWIVCVEMIVTVVMDC